jgi:hypothetical protein
LEDWFSVELLHAQSVLFFPQEKVSTSFCAEGSGTVEQSFSKAHELPFPPNMG